MLKNINITSKLLIKTFCDNKLLINLKQGEYTPLVNQEELILLRTKEELLVENLNWTYEGDEDYTSLETGFPYLVVSDKNLDAPDIESEWAEDNVTNVFQYHDQIIFEIPCGNGGAVSIYTAKNEKNEIIAVCFNGIHADDM